METFMNDSDILLGFKNKLSSILENLQKYPNIYSSVHNIINYLSFEINLIQQYEAAGQQPPIHGTPGISSILPQNLLEEIRNGFDNKEKSVFWAPEDLKDQGGKERYSSVNRVSEEIHEYICNSLLSNKKDQNIQKIKEMLEAMLQ